MTKIIIKEVHCPYCFTTFPHTGKVELHECPGCHCKLIVGQKADSGITYRTVEKP